mmetsp:Transcript_13151/g.26688  ORF Transcript_13151/g.26688 Transcript_13151/m.26688 type:complete len:144 (+) Transcript_13151:1171-1602(+)
MRAPLGLHLERILRREFSTLLSKVRRCRSVGDPFADPISQSLSSVCTSRWASIGLARRSQAEIAFDRGVGWIGTAGIRESALAEWQLRPRLMIGWCPSHLLGLGDALGDEKMWASSTLKKRRLKMNKHKQRKRRKRDRAKTRR